MSHTKPTPQLDRYLPLRIKVDGLDGACHNTIESRERPHGATVSDPEFRGSGLVVRDKIAVVDKRLPFGDEIAAEMVRRVNAYAELEAMLVRLHDTVIMVDIIVRTYASRPSSEALDEARSDASALLAKLRGR